MKKSKILGMHALILAGLLGLTGCGAGTQEDLREAPRTTDTGKSEVTQERQETSGDGAENERENDSPDDGRSASEDPGTSSNGKTAVYSQDGLYMSVDIPDGWDCRIKTKEELEKEDGLTLCEIDFWPESYPDTVFELSYETSFGICGTGVTIEEFTLPNRLDGYRYTEEIEDTLWLTITLRNPDTDISGGTYLILASPTLSVWESIQPEFEEILQSVWVGSLSGGQAAAGGASSGQGTDTVSSEYISLEEAKSAALANAKLEADQVTFIKEKLDYDDGVAEYDIEFVTETTRYEYEISAKDGTVLKLSQEGIEQINNIQVHDGISVEEAKKIALDYAGYSEDEVIFSKMETDHEDGRIEYEIEFYVGKKEYSFSIDAVSGKILEVEIDQD